MLCLNSSIIILSGVLSDYDNIQCCKSVSFLQCNQILLSLYQISVGWIGIFPIYILMLTFYPNINPDDIYDKYLHSHYKKWKIFDHLLFILYFLDKD